MPSEHITRVFMFTQEKHFEFGKKNKQTNKKQFHEALNFSRTSEGDSVPNSKVEIFLQ